jgi:hypothetical protein
MKDKTTNAPITGKVQGDFTIQISRGTTGNISTTGITITEVSAANNPGQYDVVGSGATGFTATTAGKCMITIRLTADDTYSYEQTILVTANGDFDGTSGAASFTATANDGRITDGTNPISGATVRLRNSANTIVALTTSNASGLWGPEYLDETVTMDVTMSGYGSNSSNQITVVGSTATGPLTDVALTAVTSSSGILNSDLLAYTRVQCRNQSGTQSDTTQQQIVNNSIGWIATAKFWEFYKTYGDITLREPYSTGTIALTAGSTTCTLTTGTWPTWAASGKIKVGSRVLRIASRTSGSVVVLATAWAEDAEATATYTIYQDEYALPSDCLKFGEPFPTPSWGWGGQASSFESVLRAQNLSGYPGQNFPSMFAVHGSGGTAKLLLFPYPNPSEDMLLPFWYYRKPALLVSAGDTADVDPLWTELLHRSIDYQIAPRYEAGVAGRSDPVYKQLMECFARAAANDKGPLNPTGPMGANRAAGPIRPRLTG